MPETATHLEFHPLTFAEEPDGITVGRADIESFSRATRSAPVRRDVRLMLEAAIAVSSTLNQQMWTERNRC